MLFFSLMTFNTNILKFFILQREKRVILKCFRRGRSGDSGRRGVSPVLTSPDNSQTELINFSSAGSPSVYLDFGAAGRRVMSHLNSRGTSGLSATLPYLPMIDDRGIGASSADNITAIEMLDDFDTLDSLVTSTPQKSCQARGESPALIATSHL